MKNMLKRFMKDERGLELAEWAIMAALIIAVAATVITLLGQAISDRFQEVTDAITD